MEELPQEIGIIALFVPIFYYSERTVTKGCYYIRYAVLLSLSLLVLKFWFQFTQRLPVAEILLIGYICHVVFSHKIKKN